MGMIRWLDRIDPAVWDHAVRRIEEQGPALLDRAEATAFLREFGKDLTEDTLRALEDAEDETLHPTLLNGLLEAAVTMMHWELDKSLNGLAVLSRLLPGGQSLNKIIEFKGIDVEVPEICGRIESGLYGCCSSAALADCRELAQRFGPPAEVMAVLKERRPALLDRLLGRSDRASSAADLMTQDYYAGNWQAFCNAVLETTTKGHYLGLGMSV